MKTISFANDYLDQGHAVRHALAAAEPAWVVADGGWRTGGFRLRS